MSLEDIQTRLAAAAKQHDRNPDDIHLIAVSKVQPLNRVEAVLEQGHRVFGENRVQEAQGKW
ncbi:MAG: YggS family pyridoxal phosphate-dependent enzyme, partial [Pseudomonadota bacterium]